MGLIHKKMPKKSNNTATLRTQDFFRVTAWPYGPNIYLFYEYLPDMGPIKDDGWCHLLERFSDVWEILSGAPVRNLYPPLVIFVNSLQKCRNTVHCTVCTEDMK